MDVEIYVSKLLKQSLKKVQNGIRNGKIQILPQQELTFQSRPEEELIRAKTEIQQVQRSREQLLARLQNIYSEELSLSSSIVRTRKKIYKTQLASAINQIYEDEGYNAQVQEKVRKYREERLERDLARMHRIQTQQDQIEFLKAQQSKSLEQLKQKKKEERSHRALSNLNKLKENKVQRELEIIQRNNNVRSILEKYRLEAIFERARNSEQYKKEHEQKKQQLIKIHEQRVSLNLKEILKHQEKYDKSIKERQQKSQECINEAIQFEKEYNEKVNRRLKTRSYARTVSMIQNQIDPDVEKSWITNSLKQQQIRYSENLRQGHKVQLKQNDSERLNLESHQPRTFTFGNYLRKNNKSHLPTTPTRKDSSVIGIEIHLEKNPRQLGNEYLTQLKEQRQSQNSTDLSPDRQVRSISYQTPVRYKDYLQELRNNSKTWGKKLYEEESIDQLVIKAQQYENQSKYVKVNDKLHIKRRADKSLVNAIKTKIKLLEKIQID